jgi:hypothetical protein
MDFNLTQIVEQKRDTSAGYHFLVGRAWRLIGEPKKLHSPLAYGAFEFRCSIERSVFELFVLIKDNNLSKDDLKAADKLSRLRKTILKLEGGAGLFHRKLMFGRIYAKGSGAPSQYWPSVPDLARLESYWAKLSEYCHRQLQPKATWESMGNQWLNDGYNLLNDVETYLWEVTVTSPIGWVPVEKLPLEMKQARLDYIEGRITEQELETRMTLMAHVLEDRFRQQQRRRDGV